jgi:Uma2 family endonuclease
MRIYAREHIPHAWLIDPLERTLEVFRLEGEHWLLASANDGDEPVRAEPFDAIELLMKRWWID